MQTVFEIITEVILERLGALIKKLLGRPLSESGFSEAVIGALLIMVVVGIVALLIRSF
jgi:hypothetical protein